MTTPNIPLDTNKPEILQILEQGQTPATLREKETKIDTAIKSDVESLAVSELEDISTEDLLNKVLNKSDTDVFGKLGKLLAEDIEGLNDEYMSRVKHALRLKIREQLNSSSADDDIKMRLNQLLGAQDGLPNLPGRINFGLDEHIHLTEVMITSMTDAELIELRNNKQLLYLTVLNAQGKKNEHLLQQLRKGGYEWTATELREWLLHFTKVNVQNTGGDQELGDLDNPTEDELELLRMVASDQPNPVKPETLGADEQIEIDFDEDEDEDDNFSSISSLSGDSPDASVADRSLSDITDLPANVEPISHVPSLSYEDIEDIVEDPFLGPDDTRDSWPLESDQPGPRALFEGSHPNDPFAAPEEQSNIHTDLNRDPFGLDTSQPGEAQVPELDFSETFLQTSTKTGGPESGTQNRPAVPRFTAQNIEDSTQPTTLEYPQDNAQDSIPPSGSPLDFRAETPSTMPTQSPPEGIPEGLDPNFEQIRYDVELLRPQLGDTSLSMEDIKKQWQSRGVNDDGWTNEESRVEDMVKFLAKKKENLEKYVTNENQPIIERAVEYYERIILPELNQGLQGDASPQTPHSAGPSPVQPVINPSGAPQGRRPARRTLDSVAPTPQLDLNTVAGRRAALEQNPQLMAMAEERFYRDLDDIFSRPPTYNIDDAVDHYLSDAEPGHKQAMAMALGLEFDITQKTFHRELESVVNAYNQRYFSDQGRKDLSRNELVRADMEELALDTLHKLYGQITLNDTSYADYYKQGVVDTLTDQEKVALAIYYKIGGDLTKPATLNKLRNKITSEEQAHGLIQPDGSFLYGSTNPLVEDIYFDVMSEFHAEDLRKPEVKAKIAKMVSMRVMQEKLDLIQAKYDEANAPQWHDDFGKLARVAAPGVLAAMMFSGLLPASLVGETVGAGAFALLKGWGSALVASEGFALSGFGYFAAAGFFAANTGKHFTKLINPFGNIKKEHQLEKNLMTTLRGGGKLMTSRANGELQVSNVNPEAGMQRRQIMDMQKKWKDERRTIYQTTFSSMQGQAASLNSPSEIFKAIHAGVGEVDLENISKLQAVSAGKHVARVEKGFSASMMGIPSLLGYAGKKIFA